MDRQRRTQEVSMRAGSSGRTCAGSSRRSWLSSARTAACAVVAIVCLSSIPTAHAANVTSLTGTWSSGSGAVLTGPGFAQPTNFTFTYPSTTGISYSFTDDGYFEEAQYRFVANGSEPHCVQAVVIWQHGNYTLNRNGTISLTPIASDGRIQVQDPCAETTNVITYYSQSEYFAGWSITSDINTNRYMLQLLRFDGAFLPRMYLYYSPPTMLPVQQLWTSESYKAYQQEHGAGAVRNLKQSSAPMLAIALGAIVILAAL